MQPFEHVILEVARERERQISVEGWTPEHDDEHTDGQLARAASCYAHYSATDGHQRAGQRYLEAGISPVSWPFHASWWKPRDKRRDLVRAAALIVAEIERLDRAAANAP